MSRSLTLSLVTSCFALALTGACGDSNTTVEGAEETDNSTADAGGGDAGKGGSNSAVLVSAGTIGPNDTYNTYVRIFPNVPEGELDLKEFREFGNAITYVNAGAVFVEEDSRVKRFTVDEDLQLVDGEEFTWADFGIAGANASYTVFASATRAYTFSPQLGIIVVWDPEQMVRVNVIEFDFPERPAGWETWANDGYRVGDHIIWNVFSGSFDAITVHPALTLAIIDINDEGPVSFVEDDRCLPGGPSFVDSKGDYYVHGAGYFGYFAAYGSGRTCALRVNAGTTTFDPNFLFDYEDAIGTPFSDPWIGVTDDHYFTYAWDPSNPIPEDMDAFWSAPRVPRLVDFAAGTSEPYPDLEGLFGFDGITRVVDGVRYYQVSDEVSSEGGESEVVELRVDGIRPKFKVKGAYLGSLERVR